MKTAFSTNNKKKKKKKNRGFRRLIRGKFSGEIIVLFASKGTKWLWFFNYYGVWICKLCNDTV